jgi:hypothetical protein
MRSARWRNKQFETHHLGTAATEHEAIREVEAPLNKDGISLLSFVAQCIGKFLSAGHPSDSTGKQSNDRGPAQHGFPCRLADADPANILPRHRSIVNIEMSAPEILSDRYAEGPNVSSGSGAVLTGESSAIDRQPAATGHDRPVVPDP